MSRVTLNWTSAAQLPHKTSSWLLHQKCLLNSNSSLFCFCRNFLGHIRQLKVTQVKRSLWVLGFRTWISMWCLVFGQVYLLANITPLVPNKLDLESLLKYWMRAVQQLKSFIIKSKMNLFNPSICDFLLTCYCYISKQKVTAPWQLPLCFLTISFCFFWMSTLCRYKYFTHKKIIFCFLRNKETGFYF